jgi:UDP-N-acetylmuramoylalanine--D-glutamate ligase
MELRNRHIVVTGLGVSGLAATRFLLERGAEVTVSESADARALGDLPGQVAALGAKLELGGHHEATFTAADLVVVSPGVPHTIAPLEQARSAGIPVIGEVELAAAFIRAPMVAVTGTNGKTTTTTLLGQMLSRSGLSVFTGGNIGAPLIDAARGDWDAVVAEVSSFQLDTTRSFHPAVAVLLNITDDHLDRYTDFEAYARSKALVFRNQNAADTAVLPEGDPVVAGVTGDILSRRLTFGGRDAAAVIRRLPAENGFAVDLETGRLRLPPDRFPGRHNAENVAAAGLAALAAGGNVQGLRLAIENFRPLAHRMSPVGQVAGVRFVDDSKATNVNAVVRALEAFETPVVLIMGGRDKGGDYRPLEGPIAGKVKRLVLLGEAAPIIKDALGTVPPLGYHTAATMEEAVATAYRTASPGDIVLLSPACSSFDMYASYGERGDHFQKIVAEMT